MIYNLSGFNISVKIKNFISFILSGIKEASKASDTRAEAEFIIDNYGNSILRLAYSYLHNISDAEDILQDTLLQYIKQRPKLADTNHRKAWLLKVAANLSKNKIKYNKAREHTELEDNITVDSSPDLAFVWEAVKSLPQKYCEVIHLYYQEGYSSKEIAEILSKKDSTIRSLLKRGREILKELLKEEYDFEI